VCVSVGVMDRKVANLSPPSTLAYVQKKKSEAAEEAGGSEEAPKKKKKKVRALC